MFVLKAGGEGLTLNVKTTGSLDTGDPISFRPAMLSSDCGPLSRDEHLPYARSRVGSYYIFGAVTFFVSLLTIDDFQNSIDSLVDIESVLPVVGASLLRIVSDRWSDDGSRVMWKPR